MIKTPIDTRTTTQTPGCPPPQGPLRAQMRGPSASTRPPGHSTRPHSQTHMQPALTGRTPAQSISCLSAQVIFTKSLRSLRRFFLIINF